MMATKTEYVMPKCDILMARVGLTPTSQSPTYQGLHI